MVGQRFEEIVAGIVVRLPAAPITVENDEKQMNCSSGRSSVATCRFHAPSILVAGRD